MSHAATTLDAARSNCFPRPLESIEEIQTFWIETQPARDPLTSFRRDLHQYLDQDLPQRVLVHGHRGCGKSTELNKFVSELGPEWLVVNLNAGDFLPVSGNEAADILLAMCTRIIELAKEKQLPLNPGMLNPVLKFFAETTEKSTDSREGNMEIGAGADSSEGLLGKLLGLSAKFTAALKFGSRSETSTVQIVRRRKGELCAAVNALGLGAEQAWRTYSRRENGKLLLVVEELDKLGLADARQIFVNDGRLLGAVTIRCVYTIPVFTFHSPEARAIQAYFDQSVSLPMIKVSDPKGQPIAEGRAVLREIVRRRVAQCILPDDAVDLLIDRTGGVLRDMFDAIQSSVQFLPVQRTGVIDREAIKVALDRMVTTIGLQIGYPPEEKRAPEPLQRRLAEIVSLQSQGQRVTTQPDPDLQLLLMSGALIEYNGERWLGVHPLAKEYLAGLPPHVTAPQP